MRKLFGVIFYLDQIDIIIRNNATKPTNRGLIFCWLEFVSLGHLCALTMRNEYRSILIWTLCPGALDGSRHFHKSWCLSLENEMTVAVELLRDLIAVNYEIEHPAARIRNRQNTDWLMNVAFRWIMITNVTCFIFHSNHFETVAKQF